MKTEQEKIKELIWCVFIFGGITSVYITISVINGIIKILK